MVIQKKGSSHKTRRPRPQEQRTDLASLATPGSTGSEAAYLKSLVDSRAPVTVVLTTGERMQGHIRYYDRDCFSIRIADGGPKIFLRKASVSYISED